MSKETNKEEGVNVVVDTAQIESSSSSTTTMTPSDDTTGSIQNCWTCPQCTLLNPTTKRRCQVCGSRKGITLVVPTSFHISTDDHPNNNNNVDDIIPTTIRRKQQKGNSKSSSSSTTTPTSTRSKADSRRPSVTSSAPSTTEGDDDAKKKYHRKRKRQSPTTQEQQQQQEEDDDDQERIIVRTITTNNDSNDEGTSRRRRRHDEKRTTVVDDHNNVTFDNIGTSTAMMMASVATAAPMTTASPPPVSELVATISSLSCIETANNITTTSLWSRDRTDTVITSTTNINDRPLDNVGMINPSPTVMEVEDPNSDDPESTMKVTSTVTEAMTTTTPSLMIAPEQTNAATSTRTATSIGTITTNTYKEDEINTIKDDSKTRQQLEQQVHVEQSYHHPPQSSIPPDGNSIGEVDASATAPIQDEATTTTTATTALPLPSSNNDTSSSSDKVPTATTTETIAMIPQQEQEQEELNSASSSSLSLGNVRHIPLITVQPQPQQQTPLTSSPKTSIGSSSLSLDPIKTSEESKGEDIVASSSSSSSPPTPPTRSNCSSHSQQSNDRTTENPLSRSNETDNDSSEDCITDLSSTWTNTSTGVALMLPTTAAKTSTTAVGSTTTRTAQRASSIVAAGAVTTSPCNAPTARTAAAAAVAAASKGEEEETDGCSTSEVLGFMYTPPTQASLGESTQEEHRHQFHHHQQQQQLDNNNSRHHQRGANNMPTLDGSSTKKTMSTTNSCSSSNNGTDAAADEAPHQQHLLLQDLSKSGPYGRISNHSTVPSETTGNDNTNNDAPSDNDDGRNNRGMENEYTQAGDEDLGYDVNVPARMSTSQSLMAMFRTAGSKAEIQVSTESLDRVNRLFAEGCYDDETTDERKDDVRMQKSNMTMNANNDILKGSLGMVQPTLRKTFPKSMSAETKEEQAWPMVNAAANVQLFASFQTAGSKATIAVSEQSLQRANRLLSLDQEPVDEATSYTSQTGTTTKPPEGKELPSIGKVEQLWSMVDEGTNHQPVASFQTAGSKATITVSKQSLDRANRLLFEEPADEVIRNKDPLSLSRPVYRAHGAEIETSDSSKNLPKGANNSTTSRAIHRPATIGSSFGGSLSGAPAFFQTAGTSKAITVSKESLERASRLLEQGIDSESSLLPSDTHKNTQQTLSIVSNDKRFTTASSTDNQTPLSDHASFVSSTRIGTSKADDDHIIFSSSVFQTAGTNKAIKVSSESLERASRLLEAEDNSTIIPLTSTKSSKIVTATTLTSTVGTASFSRTAPRSPDAIPNHQPFNNDNWNRDALPQKCSGLDPRQSLWDEAPPALEGQVKQVGSDELTMDFGSKNMNSDSVSSKLFTASFQTAGSGTTVKVSDESFQRATKMFEESPKRSMHLTYPLIQREKGIVSREIEDCEANEASVSASSRPFVASFQTAGSGTTVAVSDENLERVTKIFEESPNRSLCAPFPPPVQDAIDDTVKRGNYMEVNSYDEDIDARRSEMSGVPGMIPCVQLDESNSSNDASKGSLAQQIQDRQRPDSSESHKELHVMGQVTQVIPESNTSELESLTRPEIASQMLRDESASTRCPNEYVENGLKTPIFRTKETAEETMGVTPGEGYEATIANNLHADSVGKVQRPNTLRREGESELTSSDELYIDTDKSSDPETYQVDTAKAFQKLTGTPLTNQVDAAEATPHHSLIRWGSIRQVMYGMAPASNDTELHEEELLESASVMQQNEGQIITSVRQEFRETPKCDTVSTRSATVTLSTENPARNRKRNIDSNGQMAPVSIRFVDEPESPEDSDQNQVSIEAERYEDYDTLEKAIKHGIMTTQSHECHVHGVHDVTMTINSQNASKVWFEKNGTPVAPIETIEEINCKSLGGISDIRQSLIENGCDADRVKDSWIRNHKRWIVWKLASYERRFSKFLGGRHLTYTNLVRNVVSRFQKEVIEGRRPAIRKVMNRDVTASAMMVLVVCQFLVPSSDGDKSVSEKPRVILELSDGWYSLKGEMDSKLSSYVEKGFIRVGTKLLVSNAHLAGADDGVDPLDEGDGTSCQECKVSLQLAANSTRVARWDAKLGFVTSASPRSVARGQLLIMRISDIVPGGGNVPVIRLFVHRVYPIMYLEKCEGGRHERSTDNIMRRPILTEQEEEIRRREHERKKLIAIEKVTERIQEEIEKEVDENAPEAWQRFVRSTNPEDIFATMNESDREAITKWQAHRSSMIRRRIHEEVESELEVETSLLRESTPFVRIKVHSIDPIPTRTESCVLTLWQPTEEQLSLLKDGNAVQMQNLTVRESSHDGQLQLAANSRTVMEPCPIPPASLLEKIDFHHRYFLNLFQVHKLCHSAGDAASSMKTHGSDFDVAAVQINLVETPDIRDKYRIYVTDETGLILRIHCREHLWGMAAKGFVSDGNHRFIPVALCDLCIMSYDPGEQCAVAEFGELSSHAAGNNRIEDLARWVAMSQDNELLRIASYCQANIPYWDGGEQLTAFGYVIGLSSENSEKLCIEVDCCGQGLHKWELPAHVLESMIVALNSSEEQTVLLMPEEESRVSRLGVLGPTFRSRGVLWQFRVLSNQSHDVVLIACKADRAALGRLYQTWQQDTTFDGFTTAREDRSSI